MKIIKNKKLLEANKLILTEAPKKRKTSIEVPKELNSVASVPAEVTKLFELLQANPVNVIKAAEDTYNFPSMPDEVRKKTKELTDLLEADADSKLIMAKARDYANLLQTWYGPPQTDYVWNHKAATTKTKVKGLDVKTLGNTIIGSILNRTAPTGGETNSSYDAFVTHIKSSVANARQCLGLGDKATNWTTKSDIIDTIRCLYLSLEERIAFDTLSSKASEAAKAIADYANNIKGSSWSNDSRTNGPAIFTAAIEKANAFLTPYGSSIASALGNTLDHYNSGPAARKTAPEAYTAIADLNSALDAVIDWITKEQAQDASVQNRQADYSRISAKNVNWSQLYNQARANGHTTEFFSQYFEEEWGDWAPNIQRLEKIFIQEVQSLGFGIHNPFIFYLKTLQNNCKSEPANGISLVSVKSAVINNLAKVYPAIHNAYVKGQLSSADLKGTGKLGPYNIIFCPALFTQAQNPASYVELQASLIKHVESGKWSNPKIAVWGTDIIWCYTKFFYETEKTAQVTSDILNILEFEDVNNKGSEEYKKIIKDNRLRAPNTIKELFGDAFGEEQTTQVDKAISKTNDMSKSDLEELVKKLTPEAKKTLKSLLGNK